GGTVTIAAAAIPESGQIEVSVQDEGIGIAAADVERVFERFVQGEAGDRRRFGGIGLGLYIVRQLARAQNGEVTAAAGPDGGTIMRLMLPQAAAAAVHADADAAVHGGTGAAADRAASAAGGKDKAPANGRRIPPIMSRPLLPRPRTPSDDGSRRSD
ncbi:MAG TPA: ATP-binding protein, partial [Streptosporangiaceae bacterium]|nr:ATP-binding protein [Streptosporangiaceae bacterium]